MMRVEVADRSAEYAVVWIAGPAGEHGLTRTGPDSLGGHEVFVPRDQLAATLAERTPAGLWAYEARRIAAGVPRIGVDSDHRTIPNELGLLGSAVHLDKGCYRGQETIARVHNLGRPPRRLVRLHLDGSTDTLPPTGASLTLDGRAVGFVGGSARHYELGPIALGLVKRNVDAGPRSLGRRPWCGRRARRRRGPGGPGGPGDRSARPRPPLTPTSAPLSTHHVDFGAEDAGSRTEDQGE